MEDDTTTAATPPNCNADCVQCSIVLRDSFLCKLGK